MSHFATLACASALAISAGCASAATTTFDVLSADHSLAAAGMGLDTGIALTFGDSFSISAALGDFWSLGALLTRSVNADGDSEATGAPVFGTHTDSTSGQSFVFGQLVGRIGMGDYFLVGTDFSGAANATGNLFLLNWDSNSGDNTGSIAATVQYMPSSVPLPASLPLLLAAIGGFGALRRRRSGCDGIRGWPRGATRPPWCRTLKVPHEWVANAPVRARNFTRKGPFCAQSLAFPRNQMLVSTQAGR